MSYWLELLSSEFLIATASKNN